MYQEYLASKGTVHQEDVRTFIALADTCSRFDIDFETARRTVAACSKRN